MEVPSTCTDKTKPVYSSCVWRGVVLACRTDRKVVLLCRISFQDIPEPATPLPIPGECCTCSASNLFVRARHDSQPPTLFMTAAVAVVGTPLRPAPSVRSLARSLAPSQREVRHRVATNLDLSAEPQPRVAKSVQGTGTSLAFISMYQYHLYTNGDLIVRLKY